MFRIAIDMIKDIFLLTGKETYVFEKLWTVQL